MMKRPNILLLVFFLIVTLMSTASVARKGVGIVWSQQTLIMDEDSTQCIQYGVYNPWDEGVNALISVSESLEEVLEVIESNEAYVAPETMHQTATQMEICFSVPKVYESDCLAAGLLPPLRPGDTNLDHRVGDVSVVVIHPTDGEVLAMVGEAWQPHPAGSAFQPLLI